MHSPNSGIILNEVVFVGRVQLKALQSTTEVIQPMPDTKWLTQKEIAEMLGVPLSKLYPRVSALRKAGVIETRQDPDDDRLILISSDSLDVIRKAVGRDGNS